MVVDLLAVGHPEVDHQVGQMEVAHTNVATTKKHKTWHTTHKSRLSEI